MPFDVFHERQAEDLAQILEALYPQGCTIRDVTFGTGSLWWKVFETPRLSRIYKVIASDAKPFRPKAKVKGNRGKFPKGFKVFKRELLKDHFNDLSKADVVLVDLPYKIGKPSHKEKPGIMAVQLQGPRSWAQQGGDLSRYMYNKTEGEFIQRIKAVNEKAPGCLKEGGRLINKIMHTANKKGGLAAHPYTSWQYLTNFQLEHDPIYVRHDTTPYKNNAKFERIYGHFQIYQMKPLKERLRIQDQILQYRLQDYYLADETITQLSTVCKARNLGTLEEAINYLYNAQTSRRGKNWTKLKN